MSRIVSKTFAMEKLKVIFIVIPLLLASNPTGDEPWDLPKKILPLRHPRNSFTSISEIQDSPPWGANRFRHLPRLRRRHRWTQHVGRSMPMSHGFFGRKPQGQRWDRAGRAGFGGMTRPARRRDLGFLDRPARPPSGFRPSDRLGPMF